MIDLHMHSIYSDGTHTPEELIEHAVQAELSAVALTDHDTVRRRTVTPAEALEIIRDAGGLPVLAHPFTLNANRLDMRRLIRELKDDGLEGLEVYYPRHTAEQTRDYLNVASDFDLVPTGGTDFHGGLTPDLKMGRGFGALRVPDDIVDRLRARVRTHGSLPSLEVARPISGMTKTISEQSDEQ